MIDPPNESPSAVVDPHYDGRRPGAAASPRAAAPPSPWLLVFIAYCAVVALLLGQFGLEDPADPVVEAAPLTLSATTAYVPLPPATTSPPTLPAAATQPAVRLTPPTTTLPAPTWSSTPQPYPRWSTTPAGVPFYSGRGACTPAQADVIAAEFFAAGASASTAGWAVYVASRETGCDTSKRNQNSSTGDDSFCWFQINALAGWFSRGVLSGFDRFETLRDGRYCARAAATVWVECGRAPWTKPRYGCRPESD